MTDCANFLDKDFRAGYFNLEGLPDGSYTLTEVLIPYGYSGPSVSLPTKTITSGSTADWGTIRTCSSRRRRAR